jgi:hypothetical protein
MDVSSFIYLFIFTYLLNDVTRNPERIVPDDRSTVNNELKRIWKGTIETKIMILSWHENPVRMVRVLAEIRTGRLPNANQKFQN